MIRTNHNVLVSSASAKIPSIQAVRDAAAKVHSDIRVIAGDLNPNALSQYTADAFWAMPPTEDARYEAILAGCLERGIGTVIPTRDGELGFWSRHAERFRAHGVSVVVSPTDAVACTLDKLRFSQISLDLGLPVIPAWLEPKGVGPFVVKERFGAGSRSIGIGLDRTAALHHARGLDAPVFQPYVKGTEISVDAWLDRKGRVKGLVFRTRDCVVDGESKVTTTFRQADLERRFGQGLEALGLRGPVVMQAMFDGNGEPHIIEVNARFGGASTASIMVGLDVWYWSLLEADGIDVSEYPFQRLNSEVRQIRIPSDLHQYNGQR